MNAPVLGAEATFGEPGTWSMAFSWRHQKSDRHFWINQLEVAVTRTVSPRWSFTFGIPYLMAKRSNAIRDPFLPPNEFGNDPVVMRAEAQA